MKYEKSVPVRIAALTLACIAAALVAGCGGGGGGGGAAVVDVTAPTILSANEVLPAGFSFQGGPVTLQAVVTDDVGVASVEAAVSEKDGPLIAGGQVTMTRVSGNTYQAVVTAPANTNSTPLVCNVAIVARDAEGNATPRSFSFSVPAVSGGGPPPPPVL